MVHQRVRASTTMAHFVPSTADPTVWRQFVGDILGQRDHFLSRLKDAERSQEYYMDRCTKLRAKMRDLRSDNDEQLKAMRQQLEQCQGSEVLRPRMTLQRVLNALFAWRTPCRSHWCRAATCVPVSAAAQDSRSAPCAGAPSK